jgi:DNA-binding protein YbaB
MMQQLKKMQQEMARVQDELANTVVEGVAAGGVVTASVNDAIVKAKALSEQKMGRLTGGMKIPGLM